MSAFVLDASVAAKWFVHEEYSANAHRLLERGDEPHAPDFLYLEADNFVCKWIRRGVLSATDGDAARIRLASASIRRHPTEGLRSQAYFIAVQTGCTVYDSLYLSLAIQIGLPLVTADRRFYETMAKGTFAKHVAWLGDIA